MHKEYMLLMVNKRLEQLKKQYYDAVNGKDLKGRISTKQGAAVTRSRLKRDICILELVKELLQTSEAVFITNQDACMGFDKLLKE